MRLIDADALKEKAVHYSETEYHFEHDAVEIDDIDDAPTVEPSSPWRRVEDKPLPNQDLLLHDEHGYYHVGYISTYRGYTEYIDMDGNALHGIDYWRPIEPPKEDA